MVTHSTETWHASPAFYYRKGGGPVYDMAPYYLTVLVYLLGSIKSISAVSATSSSQRPIYSAPLRGTMMDVEVPTSYAAVLEFESGVIANLNMSFDCWRSHLPQMEIYGSDGVLEAPDPNMCGGEIRRFRKETILEHLGSGRQEGNQGYRMEQEFFEDCPLRYPLTASYTRGLGPLEMAYALAESRPCRITPELAYHVTEAMLGLTEAAADRRVYHMRSTCPVIRDAATPRDWIRPAAAEK